MNRLLILCAISIGFVSNSTAQTLPPPKVPIQMPAATAMAFVNNYKASAINIFAYGYLVNLAKAKSMSATGVRIYNGVSGMTQSMVTTPLNSTFKTATGAPCAFQADASLCPHACDIATPQDPATISALEAVPLVNECMECLRYETVNALVLHTSTLNALIAGGYSHVRVYNGLDANNKRYVVYVPIDATGKEVAAANYYVGDNTNVLTNCKYP